MKKNRKSRKNGVMPINRKNLLRQRIRKIADQYCDDKLSNDEFKNEIKKVVEDFSDLKVVFQDIAEVLVLRSKATRHITDECRGKMKSLLKGITPEFERALEHWKNSMAK